MTALDATLREDDHAEPSVGNDDESTIEYKQVDVPCVHDKQPDEGASDDTGEQRDADCFTNEEPNNSCTGERRDSRENEQSTR